MLAGIGFTITLFIAGLAFQGALLDAAKLGILGASVLSAAGGLALLAWLARGGCDRLAVADNADGRWEHRTAGARQDGRLRRGGGSRQAARALAPAWSADPTTTP